MDVEVVFPDICGAFYKATLLDIDVSDGKCLVSFQDGWKPNSWVELQHVKYPPQSTPTLDLSSGAKVEAFLPFKEGEPGGWWPATITKSKGEVAGVQFQMGGDSVYTDLVEHQYLRMPNDSIPLSELHFFQKEYPVPQDILEFCRDPKVHSNFHNKIQALSATYDIEKESLIVLADDQRCLEKAELLIDMHFNDLSTQAALKSRTERAAQRLQQPLEDVHDTSGVHEEKFFISSELIGYAMGKQGWNVNQARQVEGVLSIDFDDFNSMFTIRSETKEAALSARELIEFTREVMYIPRDLAGKVIGKGGNVVQQILEKSKLNNIKVIGDEEAKERKLNTQGNVPFELVGRRKAIDNAKMMMEYHLDHLREVDTILQDREEITRKLRDSGIDDTPTFYPRPNPIRGPRGRGKQRAGANDRRPGRRRPRNEQNGEVRENEYEPQGETQTHSSGTEDSESTEEEQQQEENNEKDDSPADDVPTASPDRRRRRNPNNNGRRKKGKGRPRGGRGYSERRRANGPTTTEDNEHENEDGIQNENEQQNGNGDWPPAEEPNEQTT